MGAATRFAIPRGHLVDFPSSGPSMGVQAHPMNAPDFKAKLREVPHQPGVYLMKDRLGSIIYVGKARDLKQAPVARISWPRRKRAPT